MWIATLHCWSGALKRNINGTGDIAGNWWNNDEIGHPWYDPHRLTYHIYCGLSCRNNLTRSWCRKKANPDNGNRIWCRRQHTNKSIEFPMLQGNSCSDEKFQACARPPESGCRPLPWHAWCVPSNWPASTTVSAWYNPDGQPVKLGLEMHQSTGLLLWNIRPSDVNQCMQMRIQRLNRMAPIHCMVAWWITNVFCFSNWGYVTHISAAPSAIGSSARTQGSPTRSDVPTAPVVLQCHSNAGIGCKRWCSLPRSENLRATRANTYYDYETYCSSWWDAKHGGKGGDIRSLAVEFTLPVHIEALDSHRHKK